MISESTKKRLECISSVEPMVKPLKNSLFVMEVVSTDSGISENDRECNTKCLFNYVEKLFIEFMNNKAA